MDGNITISGHTQIKVAGGGGRQGEVDASPPRLVGGGIILWNLVLQTGLAGVHSALRSLRCELPSIRGGRVVTSQRVRTLASSTTVAWERAPGLPH